MNLIQVMKALGDDTRMRIVHLLKYGDLCVCEIEALLDVNQSNASRHLNKLTNAQIIEYYKVAKYVYYKLNEDTLRQYPFIREVIETEAVKLKQCKADYERLKKYRESNLGCDDLKEGKVCFNNIE